MVEKTHTHVLENQRSVDNCLGCWAERTAVVLREADKFMSANAKHEADVLTALKIRQALFDIGRD